MTDSEIIQKFTDLENRIRWLEMTNSPAPFVTDWHTQPTQGCPDYAYMACKGSEAESYHCRYEHP